MKYEAKQRAYFVLNEQAFFVPLETVEIWRKRGYVVYVEVI